LRNARRLGLKRGTLRNFLSRKPPGFRSSYLCAKKASLLLTMFTVRDALEESFPELSWDSKRQERRFAHGEWEGTRADIHEGGEPYGMETAVLHMWRESVNPNEDVPVW